MRATLKDIAHRTGFSVSTISRVLHDRSKKYKIGDATKQLIKQAAEDLGYRPNSLARGLRLRQTNEIGIVVPDISNPFFSALIKSFAAELRRGGNNFIVYDSDEDITIERASIRSLLEKRVDGIIIASVGQDSTHLEKLRNSSVPLVTVDRCFNSLDVDSVSVDNVQGTLLAVNHLIREGHTRIAFIQGLPGTYANETRLRGYKLALEQASIPVDEHLVVGDDFRSMNGYLETRLLLSMPSPPTAIFTAGDLIALGALEACKESGFRIPDDVSLATFDDPVFATYLSPALTAVEQPISRMAEMAVAMLYRRIRTPNVERRQILLEPKLNIRNSVARLAISAIEAQKESND